MRTDFTSGLFLGLVHADACGTGPLTSGVPPVLRESEGGLALAAAVARSQGAERGLLARSSLHGLVDVLESAAGRGGLVLVDEHAYPISHWAAAVARSRGATVRTYRHHDVTDARRRTDRRHAGRTVLLTDGWCGGCLRPAPLPGLRSAARSAGGTLVVDDSLAAGVLGRRSPRAPLLGSGGAGTGAWLGMRSGGVVWVSSMAKGMGAPVAVVTGPDRVLAPVAWSGPARTHATGPSRCDVAALRTAWLDPTLDRRRLRLAAIVSRVRRHLARAGLPPTGLPFPVVAVDAGGGAANLTLHRWLAARDVATLLTRASCTARPRLTICLRADHGDDEVEALLRGIGRVTR